MAANSGATKTALGPFCYENWKAAAAAFPSQGALEYPLFSDSQITGPSAPSATGAPAVTHGPYQLFNAIAMGNRTRPAIVLRVEGHWSGELDPSWHRKTNTGRYHGGDLADELAALVSLCLGIRTKSGELTRVFSWDTDPRGRPLSSIREPDPIVPPTRPTPLLSRALLTNAIAYKLRFRFKCQGPGFLPSKAAQRACCCLYSACEAARWCQAWMPRRAVAAPSRHEGKNCRSKAVRMPLTTTKNP